MNKSQSRQNQRHMNRGILITLEGNEGCGKSTQIRLLYEHLKKIGRCVYLTREPGGTVISDAIRAVLLDNKNKKMSAACETLLYMASRAQLMEEVLLPRLHGGQIVLCDRWVDATVAYQGFGAGMDVEWIKELGFKVTQGLRPDLSLFLDLPLTVGLRRAVSHKKADRMEQKKLSFHRRVRRGYDWIAQNDPKRFHRIPVSERDSIACVHEKILREVARVL